MASMLVKTRASVAKKTHENFKLFEYPFVLIQDIFQYYKPIFKQYPPTSSGNGSTQVNTYPMLYLAAAFGFCPFLRQSIRKSSVSSKSALSNSNASTSACQVAYQKSKYERVKKPGFCECCMEKYADMDEVWLGFSFLACEGTIS